MPTKKKKYNARFPPARIKKIMQKDEEVGKVASTVPVMISRLLELFTEALILKTNELTLSVNARTLTTSHLAKFVAEFLKQTSAKSTLKVALELRKQVILSERKFDFLKELVTHIPDVQANDEDGGDSNSDQGIRVRQRGRPRKKKEDEVSSVPKKRGRKPKAAAPTVEDEDLTDSSETEDADSCSDEDGGDSTSEDAVVEGRGSYQSQKRQRVDSSFGPTCSSYISANCAGVVESGAAESTANPGSSSTVPADRNGGLFQPPEPTALRFWNMPATSGNSVVGSTAGETCLPLNLATAVPAASAFASASDFNSEPHSIQLLTRPNFDGTAFGTSAAGTSSAPPGLRVLRPPPPPAHQVFTPQVVPSCMLSLNSRSSQLPQVASGFLRRLDSTGTLASQSAAPASGGSAAEDAPVGSHFSSDGMPPITTSSMPSSSGHATHRMPVVSASFLPGAVLVRSMSLPHSCSTTKTSLVTLPEDDYDS